MPAPLKRDWHDGGKCLYCSAMKCIRCLMTAVLLLVIGEDFGLSPVRSNMLEPAMQAAADQAMPADCDRCDGSDIATSASACSALGACAQGFVPVTDVMFVVPGHSLSPSHRTKHLGGLRDSPDPFPPKPLLRALG